MDIYKTVTDRITSLLEAGTCPWKKAWSAGTGMPKNLITKKEYRGVNVFLLACQEYSSPYWLTFKQAADKGGHVRKGEKSTPVVFWKWVDRKDTSDDDRENTKNGKVPLLRFYSVFNWQQTEGITAPPSPEAITNPFPPIERAEQIIANMPLRPEIYYGGNQPAYSPSLDYVKIPVRESFESPEEFYATMYHELSHATGHLKRLGRKGITEPSYFGSHEYSFEELVSEMAAAFLCGHTGIENGTIENSAAYIQGWLKALKGNQKWLVQAAAQAQKAADYILNRKGGEEPSTEDSNE